MKRIILTICLAFLLGGCNYIGFAEGQGGEFDSANFTLEFASRPPDEKGKIDRYEMGGTYGKIKTEPESEPESGKRDWMLISGLLIIDNAIDTWFYESRPEMGSFIKLGVEVAPDTGLFANVLGGLTFIHYASRWETEWETEWNGLIGGGVTYFINDKNVCLLAAYDNRRGFSGGVGFRF